MKNEVMKFVILSWIILVSSIVAAQVPDIIFQSGFEGSTQLIQFQLNGNPDPNYADIEGEDGGFDWVLDLDDNPLLGTFRIYYEVGDTTKSIASLVADPLDPNNTVLKFNIKEPHINYTDSDGLAHQKGRIQAAINGNTDLTDFYFEQKVYLHPDLDSLTTSPMEITWFTLQELWNDGANQEYPYRVTLNIQKEAGVGAPLHFGAHGQKRISPGNWESYWEVVDSEWGVPLGEWFTLSTHFIEGDALHGRYMVTLTDASGNTHEIANVVGFTHHPDDPEPDGVVNFNPMKLYTSGPLIEGMNAGEAELSVYWDDFNIWTDSLPNTGMLEGLADDFFTTYPNPTQRWISIPQNREIVGIKLYNIQGELLQTYKSSDTRMDLGSLPDATYLLVYQLRGGNTHSSWVVKMSE